VTIVDDAPRPDRVEVGKVILELGGEGGSLTVEGMRAADGWRFRFVRDESGLSALLDEEDCKGLVFRHESDWVHSFETPLGLLDNYPSTSSILSKCIPRFQAAGLGGSAGTFPQGQTRGQEPRSLATAVPRGDRFGVIHGRLPLCCRVRHCAAGGYVLRFIDPRY
jgi:hypothetical protein